MASKAYVLLEAQAGKTDEALEKLNAIHDIKNVSLVTGPYDIILTVEAEDLKQLGHIVSEQVQNVPGVTKTITCVIIG